MSDPNNPPAFPVHPNCLPGYSGMTLWDWFAGQALAKHDNSATDAANIADAMMAERAKRSAVKPSPAANCNHEHVDSLLGRFPYCIDCGAEW